MEVKTTFRHGDAEKDICMTQDGSGIFEEWKRNEALALVCRHWLFGNPLQLQDVGGVEPEHSLPLQNKETHVLTIEDVTPIESAKEGLLEFILQYFVQPRNIHVPDSRESAYSSSLTKSGEAQVERDPKYILPLRYVANLYETLVDQINKRLSILGGISEKSIAVPLSGAGGLYKRFLKRFPKEGPSAFKRRMISSSEARKMFPELVTGEEKRVRILVIHELELVEKPAMCLEDADWFKRLTGRDEASICGGDYKCCLARDKLMHTQNSVSPKPVLPVCEHQLFGSPLQLQDVGGVEPEHSLPLQNKEPPVLTIEDVTPFASAKERLLELILQYFVQPRNIQVPDSQESAYSSSLTKSGEEQVECDLSYFLPLAYVANLYETLVKEIDRRLSTLPGIHKESISLPLEGADGLYRSLLRKFPKEGPSAFKRREKSSSKVRKMFPGQVTGEEKRVHIVHGLEIVEKPAMSPKDADWFKHLTGRHEASICGRDYNFSLARHKHTRTQNSVSPEPVLTTTELAKYCDQCGLEHSEDAKFCSRCGRKRIGT